MRIISYQDMDIPYELVTSSRRTYAIQVKEDGRVIVRAPFHVSESFLEHLFCKKEKWIKQKYMQQLALSKQSVQSAYTPHQEMVMQQRYRMAAKEYIPRRVAYYRNLTGGSYQRITIREQKTRWGSCSSKGTLSFNWRLMLAPPAILDYVVVHELCHLTYMNHGSEFWKAVERILPDYRKSRDWLRVNGAKLSHL